MTSPLDKIAAGYGNPKTSSDKAARRARESARRQAHSAWSPNGVDAETLAGTSAYGRLSVAYAEIAEEEAAEGRTDTASALHELAEHNRSVQNKIQEEN